MSVGPSGALKIGVDIGGTFTDLVLIDTFSPAGSIRRYGRSPSRRWGQLSKAMRREAPRAVSRLVPEASSRNGG
jgi:N-methylhydantoinase A/oxoprolinase/acetone carboxylase beta subunit